jgi:hypothetical protein
MAFILAILFLALMGAFLTVFFQLARMEKVMQESAINVEKYMIRRYNLTHNDGKFVQVAPKEGV